MSLCLFLQFISFLIFNWTLLRPRLCKHHVYLLRKHNTEYTIQGITAYRCLRVYSLAVSILMTHSSIWYRPSPGHRPRLDPRKFRDSKKLNWSTEVLVTLTFSSKLILTIVRLSSVKRFPVIFFSTVAVVLRHGGRHWDTMIP